MRGAAQIWALGALGAALAACGEPAIDMRLQLPSTDRASSFNVSCVGAIEVVARGTDRGAFPTGPNDPGRPADDTSDCIEVTEPTSFSQLRSRMADRFELQIPESGLLGVEIRGSTGTCKKDTLPGDSIFYGAGEYTGGSITIPMTPNLSCGGTRPEVVRPVDLLELVRTGTCPAALPDSASGGVNSTTIHGSLLGPYLDFNNDFAPTVGGLSSMPLYLAADTASCVALVYSERTGARTTASCARRGAGVCSTAAQLELPIIDGNIAFQSADQALLEKYGGWVIGAIWGTDATSAKIKISGATVTPANSAKAKVVYADYGAGAAKVTSVPSATATGSSGMFIAYVGEPTDFVISAAGFRDETIRLGSPDEPSTALVMMTKR